MNADLTSTLISMGFNEAQANNALTECGGNVESAIDFLLNGGVSSNITDNSVRSASTNTTIVTSEISQYSSNSGRSACTSIALTLASRALLKLQNKTDSAENVISSSVLSDSVREGLRTYDELQANSRGVEHMSVEEILQIDIPRSPFSSIKLLPNSPRQGILSSSSHNPMGLQSILSGCQNDASNSQSYIAVVITKPPETVLVLLPSVSDATQQRYVLLDSHPRPNNFAPYYPTGSFALFHSDLHSLVRSLNEIFPSVDLGRDVNEMMAMMYNSFDVYPFEFKG